MQTDLLRTWRQRQGFGDSFLGCHQVTRQDLGQRWGCHCLSHFGSITANRGFISCRCCSASTSELSIVSKNGVKAEGDGKLRSALQGVQTNNTRRLHAELE